MLDQGIEPLSLSLSLSLSHPGQSLHRPVRPFSDDPRACPRYDNINPDWSLWRRATRDTRHAKRKRAPLRPAPA